MRKFNLCAITFAALAMIACNNEGLDSSNIHQEGELTGEQTYAVFNIAVNTTPGTMSSTDANGGIEGAIYGEAKIDNAGIYIFDYVSDEIGTSEVMTYMESLSATTDSQLPSKPVLITSGKKHIVVVGNMTDEVKTALDGAFGSVNNSFGYKKFRDVIAKQLSANPTESFIVNPTVAADLRITMTGETDKILLAGVTESEAQLASNNNNVAIYLDRNVAKLDVKMINGATIVNNKDVKASIFGATEETVGNISQMKYDVRNVNREQYVLKRIRGTFVTTPFSGLVQESDWNTDATNYSRMYPTMEAGTAGSYSFNPLAATADASGVNYLKHVAYMNENTNEVARISNSTYAALSARYIPGANYYVKGFKNDLNQNNEVTLIPAEVAQMITGYSLFNYEYNLAFESVAQVENATSISNFKTIAAYHTSKIEPALSDIPAVDIEFVAGSALPAGSTPIAITNYDVNKAITDPANTTAILAMYNATTPAVAFARPKLFVFVSKTLNTDSELEQIQMTAVYVSNLSNKWEINGGVNFGTLTSGVYGTTTAGLQCYYRANIYDPALGATHQMRHSVVRNHSYHLAISKVNKIGYPTDFDITIEPSEPLNNNTFVQTVITVNSWIGKAMDTELDM